MRKADKEKMIAEVETYCKSNRMLIVES